MENEKLEREQGWAEGVHISSNGRKTPIGEMDDRHLNNSINKYAAMGWDVSALQAEANRRKQNEQA